MLMKEEEGEREMMKDGECWKIVQEVGLGSEWEWEGLALAALISVFPLFFSGTEFR
jgi:hypothetical protein